MSNQVNDSFEQPQTTPPKLNGIYKFFCWCSGVQLNILERFPTDWNRFFGTGIIIFLTGVFAFSSSLYALSSVFKDYDPNTNINTVNYWLVVPVAFIWGLFIFFIDRYFISSMTSKSGSKLQQFFIALPRLILAAFLGIVISRPLEYRFFRDDILNELGDVKTKELADLSISFDRREQFIYREDSLRKSQTEIGRKLVAEQNTINKFRDYKKEAEIKIAAALDSMNYENVGNGKSKVKGEGPNFKRWQAEHSRLLSEYNSKDLPIWNEQIKIAQDSINSYNRKPDPKKIKVEIETKEKLEKLKRERETAIKFKEQNLSFSLLSFEKGLNNLISPKKSTDLNEIKEKVEVSSNVKGIVFFISFLFILIEMAPVIVKLLSNKGKYEEAVEQQEAEYSLSMRQRRFTVREEFKTNKGLIQKMAKSQRNIISESLKNWEAEEKRKVNSKNNDDPMFS